MTPGVQLGGGSTWRKQETANGLPCRDCGIRIDPGDARVTLTADAVERRLGGPDGPVITEDRPMDIQMGVCAACATRRERASRLLDAHPAVVRTLGSRSYVDNLLDSALLVFDVLGSDWPDTLGRRDDKQFRLLLSDLPVFGAGARWSTAFVPVVRLQADLIQPAPMRWWHLSPEQQQTLRDASGRFLLHLTDKPRPVAPPADGMRGCLLCGIGTVDAMKPDALTVWGELRRGGDRVLGGRGTPAPHVGYLCTACQKAAEKAGPGLGPTAMENSLFDFLDVRPVLFPDDTTGLYGESGITINGLVAWCTLPVGTPPNRSRWSHVNGLQELRDGLKRVETTGGLRRVS